ncbi:hypothetical protein OPT61_g5510 [Boeremia exigua]|uniref:Uncharacterized protein n=1 Tax=Boeremia exigua TaxID=749465 RepID=A0ACC2IA95_9PLEO|nr:hypothetical protein OPT61_g5510 [Boeremia exigua]
MSFESRPLPSQHGQIHETASYSPYGYGSPASLPYNLMRLHREKDLLSMRLADCVTYLKALREKQLKNTRQLNVEPAITQKRRKKLQHVGRHLDSEIRNRERDEQAFLNNLHACETNILLTNMKAYHMANTTFYAWDYTPAPTLYTPTQCSYSGSEATDLSWDGWTDDAVVSPFQKQSNNPFFVDDLAPDVCPKDPRRDSALAKDIKWPPPLFQGAAELSNSLPVPPNTAQSQFRRFSMFSPEAAIFQPSYSYVVRQDGPSESGFKRLSMSSAMATSAKELLQKRRFSTAEIGPILQRFAIDTQPRPELRSDQMGCKSNPPSNPHKGARAQTNKQRNNSL